MRRLRILVAVATLAATVAPAVGAETARQILDRRKALDDTTRKWTDRHQRLKMKILDKRGGERQRDLELYDRREPGDEQKTILFFLSPPEVKGTGFLAFTHKGRPADQWLYLPELKRVRQITASSRKESFVGTDLSYQDLDLIQEMPSWTEADARSSLRDEEAVDGTPTQVVELVPQRADIAYKKVLLWLGKDDLLPRRIEFFDDGAEPKKRITQGDVRPVGPIPVAHRIEAATPAAGSRTEILVSEVAFDQNLEPDLFSQRYLERGGR